MITDAPNTERLDVCKVERPVLVGLICKMDTLVEEALLKGKADECRPYGVPHNEHEMHCRTRNRRRTLVAISPSPAPGVHDDEGEHYGNHRP